MLLLTRYRLSQEDENVCAEQTGINLAQPLGGHSRTKQNQRELEHMRDIANGFAQLTAIIILLISLAVSTAAFSQWINP
jgi:hypothetical protein